MNPDSDVAAEFEKTRRQDDRRVKHVLKAAPKLATHDRGYERFT